jgi:hypothetical protein
MPLRWEIRHDEKLVRIVAEGPVTLKDLEAHFDALVVEDALPYCKLFIAIGAEPIYTDDEVMILGARLAAYTATSKSGPLAVVAVGEVVQSTFRRFVNISPSRRPARLFKNEALARAWLKSVENEVVDQRSENYYG